MKKETKRAIRDAFAKLSFRSQAQNPVMLMVYLSACLTTVLLALALAGISDAPWGCIAAICVVLWATVLFGNFADVIVGQWGGLDIIVDPYTLKKSAQVEITMNAWHDVFVRHDESFAAIKDIKTA